MTLELQEYFFSNGEKEKKSYIYDDDTFKEEKCISLAFVCDERICDGYYFANSVKLFNKYLKKARAIRRKHRKKWKTVNKIIEINVNTKKVFTFFS